MDMGLFDTEAEARLFARWLRIAENMPSENLRIAVAYMATHFAIERHARGKDASQFFTAVDMWQEAKLKVEKAKADRRRGAVRAQARDKRTPARVLIRREWERWQRREVTYRSDADFGRKMHVKHPEFVSDRSIAQLAAKWRKESRNTSS